MEIEWLNESIAALCMANHTVPHLVANPVVKDIKSRVSDKQFPRIGIHQETKFHLGARFIKVSKFCVIEPLKDDLIPLLSCMYSIVL